MTDITLSIGYWKTRDGRKVHIYAFNPYRYDFPWHGSVIVSVLGDNWSNWSMAGKFSIDQAPSCLDIIAPWREPVKVDGWVNVYGDGHRSSFYSSHANADRGSLAHRIACVRVTGVEE